MAYNHNVSFSVVHQEAKQSSMMDLEIADYERTVESLNAQVAEREKSIKEGETEIARLQENLKSTQTQLGTRKSLF